MKKKQTKRSKNKAMSSLFSLLDDYQVKDTNPYVSTEFQDYGYRLACELEDLKHKSLYIKMAKNEDRAVLEQARSFVADAKAKNKGALFMWKIQEIKKKKSKQKSSTNRLTTK